MLPAEKPTDVQILQILLVHGEERGREHALVVVDHAAVLLEASSTCDPSLGYHIDIIRVHRRALLVATLLTKLHVALLQEAKLLQALAGDGGAAKVLVL